MHYSTCWPQRRRHAPHWRPSSDTGYLAGVPPRSTGLAGADAQDDFLRARRRLALSRLRRWLRREPGDVDHILPFDEVVLALGRLQERDAGLNVVPIDAERGAAPPCAHTGQPPR